MPISKPIPQPIIADQIIVPCEVGRGYLIGFDDRAVGPFPSRAFAENVASLLTLRRERGNAHR